METLTYIYLPLLECLVLVGIHSYLGIHVIRRKVIFVDLALAQLAALGATVGFLFGIMPDSPAAFVFSVTFAAAGAAVFAFTRMRSERIPHEAVIGLVYAIAAALAILVIDKAPSGAEHLKEVLVGRMEWVLPREVIIAAMAYSAIGAVHWFFRERFFLISEDPEEAFRRGMRVKAWDFLFYLTFGFVISISVKVAGVLLVFVFLIAPAIAAVLITDNRLHQVLIGWGLGVVVSVTGMTLSYQASLPSGPTVVAVYAAVLMLLAVVVYLVRAENRRRAMYNILGGLAGAAVFLGFLVGLGNVLKHSALAPGHDHHHDEQIDAAKQGQGANSPEAAQAEPGEKADTDPLASVDPEEAIAAARTKLDSAERGKALEALARILGNEDAGRIYQEEAQELLEEAAGRHFAIELDAEATSNAAGFADLKTWMSSQ